jgi:hypothetical protein
MDGREFEMGDHHIHEPSLTREWAINTRMAAARNTYDEEY